MAGKGKRHHGPRPDHESRPTRRSEMSSDAGWRADSLDGAQKRQRPVSPTCCHTRSPDRVPDYRLRVVRAASSRGHNFHGYRSSPDAEQSPAHYFQILLVLPVLLALSSLDTPVPAAGSSSNAKDRDQVLKIGHSDPSGMSQIDCCQIGGLR